MPGISWLTFASIRRRDFTVVTLGPKPLEVRAWNSLRRSCPTAWRSSRECNPAVHSVALGFFVRTGSRDETDDVAGVSHFLEHMVFKGTAQHSADDVNREFDEMGANYNASTSEETTVYSTRRCCPSIRPQRSICWPTSCGRRCARKISRRRRR